MEGRPSVAVVVVTFHAAGEIGPCLATVPEDAAVVVVDNASTDATVAEARAARPDVEIVANKRNEGFAAAVNEGLARTGRYDYVLLLNPDARLEPGAVDALVTFAEGTPRCGLVSAAVVGPDGTPERFAGGRRPSVSSVAINELGLSRLAPKRSLYGPAPLSEPVRREWVAGTCVLARRTAIDDVGELDEDFFLYGEDVEWCARMWRAGWEVWVTPAARAVHGRSVSVNRAGSWVDEHRMRSLDRYYARDHGGARLVAFRLARVAGPAARAVAFASAGAVMRRPELRERGRQRRRDATLAWRVLRGR